MAMWHVKVSLVIVKAYIIDTFDQQTWKQQKWTLPKPLKGTFTTVM